MNPLVSATNQPNPPPQQPASSPSASMDTPKSSKAPVIRGARACTVCRAAKMKCVGAEDGEPCQRCKRSGAECVFEKHRRGRKPGSKLSEASKMLRRLEKGLNNAKLKSQSNDASLTQLAHDPRLFPNTELPTVTLAPRVESGSPANARSPAEGSDGDDDGDDFDKNAAGGLHPATLIKKENKLQRNNFFTTILNPENTEPKGNTPSSEGGSPVYSSRTPTRSPSAPAEDEDPCHGLKDPIAAGLITEEDASMFFDAFFLRLNPFINLFDPALHSLTYVRSRCPFLFTTIIMACCKFFRPGLYQTMKKLANEFCVRAFADYWKRVEVVQAFACLCYWKEPDETRVWMYIGFACRMSIELGLNRFVSEKRLPTETELQWLERRNRERTYLVLFVHDRSLSTQTGRQWMCHEDEIVRHSARWHEQGGGVAPSDRRPEDVILAAFVQLRLVGSETSTKLYARNAGRDQDHKDDANHSELLRQTNARLTHWMEHWESEMTKAGGEKFHVAFLRSFWLYVSLFLNAFGVQKALSTSQTGRYHPDMDALQSCYRCASEHLNTVVDDFAAIGTLRYGQDTITVMTAYCAVFLLKVLRNPNTGPRLPANAVADIHKCILRTAEAYEGAADPSNQSASAAHHARFLRGLIARDIFETKEHERLREKRDSPGSSAQSRGMIPTEGRGSNGVPVNGYPDPASVPMNQYPPYQPQQLMMSQPPPVPSQVSNNAGYVYPSPTSSSPSDNMAQPYPSQYQVTNSMQTNGNGYGYVSPHDPSPMVPSQSHHPSNSPLAFSSQSDVDYSRTMFRNIGVIGFDFYAVHPTQYTQARTQQTQQAWMNGAMSADPGYANPSYPPDYGYQQQQPQQRYDGYQR